ncbi:MAG: hypothetical protein ACO1N8_05065 [Methylophilus sp.]
MLAAISDNPRPLELVKLVLTMVAKDGENIPPLLKQFLIDVISEAKILSQDPSHAANIKNIEAIQLALEMKSTQDLADTLGDITTFESIRPQLANKMLLTMAHHIA